MDRLVGRYNQTLKTMLRKFGSHTGSDWDWWLPYLLFAYREIPQASTGFSPFELLYGHQVRGPLDLLRDYWESQEARWRQCGGICGEGETGADDENMEAAQQNQRVGYDKKARE